MKQPRLKLAFGVVLVSMLPLSGWLISKNDPLSSTDHAILEEIASADDSYLWLTPSDKAVFYMQAVESDRLLRYYDQEHDRERTIPLPNPLWKMFGWSPTQRYLLFQVQERQFGNYPRQRSAKKGWLMVLDANDMSTRRITRADDVIETEATWLDDRYFLFKQLDLTQASSKWERLLGDTETGQVEKSENSRRFAGLDLVNDPEQGLISLGRARLATVRSNEIVALHLDSQHSDQITDFQSQSFDALQWVHPHAQMGQILFCATPDRQNYRNLFRYDSASKQLNRLTDEHTYNGKWIDQGRGHAYVGNSNNRFFLAIRPADPAEHTNLFTEGWVRSYAPNPSGTKVYAEASKDHGPCGLWEYDLASRNLRQLRPGNTKPFLHAKVIEPDIFKVASYDGLEIPVYFFPAINAPEERDTPTVIFIPPSTDQCSRYFLGRYHILPNLGFNFVGINYRGCDGYGSRYSELLNFDDSARDILSITQKLIRDGRLAKGPLFLMCQSAASEIFMKVLEKEPKWWTAGVLVKPSEFRFPANLDKADVPPLYWIAGDQDPAIDFVNDFQVRAKEKGWKLEVAFIENYAHLNVDPAGRRWKETQIARYLLNAIR